MPPSEVFSEILFDAEQVKKLKLEEKYAKIKTGEYEAHEDDATEWDVNDLSKMFFPKYSFKLDKNSKN